MAAAARCAFAVLPTEHYAYRAECDCGWRSAKVSRFGSSAASAVAAARKLGEAHYFGSRRPVVAVPTSTPSTPPAPAGEQQLGLFR